MLGQNSPVYLIACAEPALLAAVEPVFIAAGVTVEIALSAGAVHKAIHRQEPLDLVLLDAELAGEETEQLLAAMRDASDSLSIVLVTDAITKEWMDRLGAGVIDDLLLRDAKPPYWELRAGRALRARRLEQELDTVREAAAREAHHDQLTGVLNREALLAALFGETDRVQRTSSALSVILFDIDDFGHWNSRLGVNACDEMLCQVAARATRLLRSYDLLGRTGKDEFLIALPGCTASNAETMAERLRTEVFAQPYRACGESVRLSACFGIAQSLGRSPVVVLREAEQAVARARELGPESIVFGRSVEPEAPPVTFLSSTSGEGLLAW